MCVWGGGGGGLGDGATGSEFFFTKNPNLKKQEGHSGPKSLT